MSQLKIYTKRKIAFKQNLEHKCILQESCKTARRWQRSILLVKGGHCVGDWSHLCCINCPMEDQGVILRLEQCTKIITWCHTVLFESYNSMLEERFAEMKLIECKSE